MAKVDIIGTPYLNGCNHYSFQADGIDNQQLMRVYGALMWSLGKVLTCPEVPRVYIGSWWDKQLRHVEMRSLFEREEQDLFRDFRSMPRGAALRYSTII